MDPKPSAVEVGGKVQLDGAWSFKAQLNAPCQQSRVDIWVLGLGLQEGFRVRLRTLKGSVRPNSGAVKVLHPRSSQDVAEEYILQRDAVQGTYGTDFFNSLLGSSGTARTALRFQCFEGRTPRRWNLSRFSLGFGCQNPERPQ